MIKYLIYFDDYSEDYNIETDYQISKGDLLDMSTFFNEIYDYVKVKEVRVKKHVVWLKCKKCK